MPVSARRLAHPHRNQPASPGVHNSHLVGGRFPPNPGCSKAETAWKWARVQMYASPNLCTPQGHHGGWRRRRDLKDPSRRKAPTKPVLKDRSWVNSPMGGYAEGPAGSHCPVAALATALTAQERKETKDWTRNPDTRPNLMALRQDLVPGSAPTGKNATFERGTCHSGAPGPMAKMLLLATAVATAHRKIPASQCVRALGPVAEDFPPFQLRTSYENTRLTKMPLASNPCTPQRHHARSLQLRGL